MFIGPGVLLNEYEILSPLGKGGMGEVFLARDTRLDRLAALKILRWETEADADRVRRFATEAKAAAALNHPNLAAVYGIGQCGQVCFIAMEYVRGETLRQAKLGYAAVIDTALQAASALEAAHAAGIIHRDIKPANIMRTESGLVKVLDFGLAKRINTGAADAGLTQAGMVMGTLGYMSPEQLLGHELDHRTDIFSLGVVIYELLSGKLPFAANTYQDALAELAGVGGSALKAPPAPAPLSAAVMRCLERDRDRRFQSAAGLAAALKAPTVAAPLPRSSRREWVLAGIGTVIGAGIAGYRFRGSAAPGPVDSLAVLPFAGGNASADIDYLREGIAESVMNRLSGVAGLRVVSRDSAFRHRGQVANEAGRLLGVRGVVTGAIHQIDGSLLVTAELVDALSAQRLWGEEFRCEGNDTLGTRDRIAGKIAGHLRLKLEVAEPGAVNPKAHDLYLRGRFLTNRLDAADVRRGLDCLNQAVAIDSKYALAHAAIAEAYLFLADMHQPALDVLPAARKAAQRAIELDPDLADGHVASAMVQMQADLDWTGAEASLRRAIEITPHCSPAHAWLGWVLSATGRREEGLSESSKAVDFEPRSPLVHTLMAANQYFAKEPGQAFESAGRALAIDPQFHLALYWRGLAMTGRSAPLPAMPNPPPVLIAALGRAQAAHGQTAKARESLEALVRAAQSQQVSAIFLAGLHAALHDKESALEWLERAYETRARLLMWTRLDPVYDGLREEPRFQALIAKMNL